ncbi:MAG: type II secretion system protein [Sedimentisphaerales bacterium]|nr:type II secretion system protein [Sedimentisphaerales bacterium]
MKDKKRGFTLVELLVVIAIIALLLAVLMPALNVARELANTAVCGSNLSQITKALYLYMMNYDENTVFAIRNANSPGDTALYWMGKLGKYMGDPMYGEQYEKGEVIKVLICPSAPAKRADEGVDLSSLGNDGLAGKAKVPWTQRRIHEEDNEYRETIGGYGINAWIAYDSFYPTRSSGSSAFKKHIDIPNETPIFADCTWICGWPLKLSLNPAPTAAQVEILNCPWLAASTNEMWHFLIDRHRMKINIAFKDTHVETVPLNKLWSLPWHRDFEKTDTVNLPR